MSLAFPGIFRGPWDVRARDINDEMKIAASEAIASLVGDNELDADYILPMPFDARVGERWPPRWPPPPENPVFPGYKVIKYQGAPYGAPPYFTFI